MNDKVRLISFTPDPQKICDSAARLSQVDKTGTEIYNTDYEKLVIKNVVNLGHHSVLEHAYFNFVFENVSVFVEHFMIEFRLGSYTVKSRRYVDFRSAGYIEPDYINNGFTHLKEDFEKHVEYLFNVYSKLREKGIPAEDARFILPYCFKSNFFLSMNGRELFHVIYSMIYGKGKKYKEIKETGEQMLNQLKSAAPQIFDNLENIIKGSEDKWDKLKLIFDDKDEKQLDKNVEILYHTDNPEDVISKAVAGVFNKNSDSLDKMEKEKILDILVNDRRARELEFINFAFIFRNITYPFLTHFVRHRIHSPSYLPFEYLDFNDVLLPPSVNNNEETKKLFNKAVEDNVEFNKKLINENVPSEEMIYSRLAGCKLNVVTSMNVRELFHFIALRTCERAQWEIRDYSIELLKQLKTISPLIFKNAGPGCVRYGKCPEGKLTCGKQEEMKEFFKNL